MRLTCGAQLRAARALARLEKVELAGLSGVSTNTIRKMEEVDGPFVGVRRSTSLAIESVFRDRGISFYDENEPGARLRLEGAQP